MLIRSSISTSSLEWTNIAEKIFQWPPKMFLSPLAKVSDSRRSRIAIRGKKIDKPLPLKSQTTTLARASLQSTMTKILKKRRIQKVKERKMRTKFLTKTFKTR